MTKLNICGIKTDICNLLKNCRQEQEWAELLYSKDRTQWIKFLFAADGLRDACWEPDNALLMNNLRRLQNNEEWRARPPSH